jgi:hypothetical protein
MAHTSRLDECGAQLLEVRAQLLDLNTHSIYIKRKGAADTQVLQERNR